MSRLREGYMVDFKCECGAEVQDIYYMIFRFDTSKIYNKMYKILERLKLTYSYNIEIWVNNIEI